MKLTDEYVYNTGHGDTKSFWLGPRRFKLLFGFIPYWTRKRKIKFDCTISGNEPLVLEKMVWQSKDGKESKWEKL